MMYVIDTGGDAFDQPTKRDAIAAARRLVKSGHSLAVVLRYAGKGGHREYLFAVWHLGGRHYDESTDSALVQRAWRELNP